MVVCLCVRAFDLFVYFEILFLATIYRGYRNSVVLFVVAGVMIDDQ